jgi:putative endonuclease
MTNPRQSLGRWGEELAARYLVERGCMILARNVRTPHGEIDLIASEGSLATPRAEQRPGQADIATIVFVEVKTRASRSLGPPEVSVSSRKTAHLLASAQYYIQQHPEVSCAWRIDVIAIEQKGGLPPEIVHFRNAVGG